MTEIEGSRTFGAGADAYDRFMGRYSRRLASGFADFAGIVAGTKVLDVGCGPGALANVAVIRCGAAHVSAVDPTPGFVEFCRHEHAGVDVRLAPAEQLPFDDGVFDRAAAQLVFHFVTDPSSAVSEMSRVLRPGGLAATCVWDFGEGMEMLRSFWDAARLVDKAAPDEADTMRFGRAGELTELLSAGGFEEVTETTLTVSSDYTSFDELWAGFAVGVGPAGAYLTSLPAESQETVREALFSRLGRPAGGFALRAVARAARGTRP